MGECENASGNEQGKSKWGVGGGVGVSVRMRRASVSGGWMSVR